MVYSLLSLLGNQSDRMSSAQVLLNLSESRDTCRILRQSGCLSSLVLLLHPIDWSSQPTTEDVEVFRRVSVAIRNLVHASGDQRRSRREAKVLRQLEQLRAYSMHLRVIFFQAITIMFYLCIIIVFV